MLPEETDLKELVSAMRAQTQAIQELVESNQRLLDWFVLQESEEAPGETYLDGTPR